MTWSRVSEITLILKNNLLKGNLPDAKAGLKYLLELVIYYCPQTKNHRFIESLRLEKTSKIIESSH